MYIIIKDYGTEGKTEPLAVLKNISDVRLFVAGNDAAYDSSLLVYEFLEGELNQLRLKTPLTRTEIFS